jgi:signal transduction histidine kinase
MSGDVRRIVGTGWLPATLAVLAVVEMAVLRPNRWAAGAALEVVACLALCARRRLVLVSPLVALAMIVLVPVLGTPLDVPTAPLAVSAFAFFSLGRYVGDRRAGFGFALVLVGIWVDYRWFDDREHGLSDVVFVLVLALPPFVLGLLLRRLAEQNTELRRTQDLVRHQAAREERDRIARELHDVVAHSVSAMVVQTAAAQDLVRVDPDRAERVLADVAATGRRALAETGRLLHVVRDSDDELGLAPTPGLAQVPELVDRFRAQGLALDVDVRLAPPAAGLPAGIDVSVYRIVQEVLTNALRYGADRRATLSIVGTGTELRIRASNVQGDVAGVGGGLGLLGMAERVEMLGGTLSHGVTPDGTFELSATLPVTP